MTDGPNTIRKQPFHKSRTRQKRKSTARTYGYSLEVLHYMLKTGIRWESPTTKDT